MILTYIPNIVKSCGAVGLDRLTNYRNFQVETTICYPDENLIWLGMGTILNSLQIDGFSLPNMTVAT